MNKFTRFALVAATSLTLANMAFASSASPKQIAALVNQADQERTDGQSEKAVKDLQEARQMTMQVIKEHPGSSKAQYYLAQIDQRLGNGEEAQQALDQTQKLDPHKHFTNDPTRVNTLQAQVNDENHDAIEKSHTHVFLGILAVIILAAVGTFFFMRRRKANAFEVDRKKYLGQVVEQNSASMAIDKDLRYQGKEDTVLARDVKELMAAQVEAMNTLQNGTWDGSTSQFTTLARGFKDVNSRYQAKNLDARENESVSYMDSLKGVRAASVGSSAGYQRSGGTYYDNSSNGSGYQYQPQGGGTTIINNTSNSNDGFVTGMMMGEMMSRPERETVIVERDRDDSYSRSSSWNDDDDERRRRSSWDSGSSSSDSSSSWDSGSSSSSSSFDSGSGSDSSWSSSDSSFDSSSSSSDSSW